MASKRQGWFTTLVVLVLFLLGLVSIWANFVFDTELYEEAEHLVEERGRVTVSRCSYREDGQCQGADIVATYSVGNQTYTATPSTWGIEGHEGDSPESLLDRFPLGTDLPVWRSSQNPSVAYLARPKPPSALQAIIGTFIVVVLFGLAARWRYRHHVRGDPPPDQPPAS